MRMAPAPERARGGRRGLGRVHPHDRARVPQADDRAARDGHRPDLGGARRRRALRARAHARHLGRGAARPRGRRLRDRLPRDPARRRAVGADGVGEPAGDAGPRRSRRCSRATRRQTRDGWDGVPRGVRAAERPGAGGAVGVQRGARAPGRCPPGSSSTSRRGSTSTSSRAKRTTPASGPARADLAPRRLDRPHLGPGLRRGGSGCRATGRVHLPLAREPRAAWTRR